MRSPAEWLAARRDNVLAALAEADRLDRSDISLLDTLTQEVRVPVVDVPSDFLRDEDAAVAPVDGPSENLVRMVLATRNVLLDTLARKCEQGPVLEIGPGAGALTRRITARPLFVLDHSVRAVLRATAGTDATPVVGEAGALPVRPRTFRTILAANVIDVLDDPASFVDQVSKALVPGGRFVCCTPDPSLGTGDPNTLRKLFQGNGWIVAEDLDGLPWLRVHGPREIQLYVVRLLVAEKRRRR